MGFGATFKVVDNTIPNGWLEIGNNTEQKRLDLRAVHSSAPVTPGNYYDIGLNITLPPGCGRSELCAWRSIRRHPQLDMLRYYTALRNTAGIYSRKFLFSAGVGTSVSPTATVNLERTVGVATSDIYKVSIQYVNSSA